MPIARSSRATRSKARERQRERERERERERGAERKKERRGRGVNDPFIIQHRRGLVFQRLVDDALSLLSRRRLSPLWTAINGPRMNCSPEEDVGG